MAVSQENISLRPVQAVSLRSTAVRGAAIGAALVAAFGLAACGGSDDEKSSSGDNTQSASVGGGASATAGQTSASAGDATDATAASGGSGSAAGGLSGFIATASTHGYTCVESPDPFLKKDGITCSPGGSDALNRAVFALFDRSVVASGEEAAEQAGSSLGSDAAATVDGGDVHADDGEGNSVDLSNIPGLDNLSDALGSLNAGPRQFRPLDSGEFAGYCLDSLGNCQASGLDAMGLTLG